MPKAKKIDLARDWDECIQIRTEYLDPAFKLEQLKRDTNSTQLRADLETPNRLKIRKAIVAAIQTGQLVPPITVVRIREGRKNWNEVISGRNRVAAAKEADQTTVRAYVLPGEYTIAQATMLAAGTNNGQIAEVTKNDKDLALFKIMTNVVTDLTWEPSDTKVKVSVKGTMPDGDPFSYRKIADLTGCGSAAISHTQVQNILCRKSTKPAHRFMVTHNEDGTVTLNNPTEYDPATDAVKITAKRKKNQKDAATAATRASEHGAKASATADQIASHRFSTADDIETANRKANEANEAAEAASTADEACGRARNVEKIQKLRDEAVKAETTARNASDDSSKNLAEIKKRKSAKDSDEVTESEPAPLKDGDRNALFVVYPKDAHATVDGLLKAITDSFTDKADAAEFLQSFTAALNARMMPDVAA